MAEWFVARAGELADGDRRIVTAGRHEIGVFFKDGAYYAYSNHCLHSGGPACEGLAASPLFVTLGWIKIDPDQVASIGAMLTKLRCRGTVPNRFPGSNFLA